MKTSLLALLIACHPIFIKAQANNYSVSQKLSAHAALSRYEPDVVSIMGNQAAALQFKGLSYGILTERKFFLDELNEAFIYLSRTVKSKNFTFMVGYVGYDQSYLLQYSLGFSQQLSEQAALGLRLNLVNQHIAGYLNSIVPGGEISLCHSISEKMQTGIQLINPHGYFLKNREKDNLMSLCWKWGMVYDVSRHSYIFADVIKKDGSPADMIIGFVFHFNKKLQASYSISFLDMSNRLTIGIASGKMNISLSGTYHGQLGFYPTVMLNSQNQKQ